MVLDEGLHMQASGKRRNPAIRLDVLHTLPAPPTTFLPHMRRLLPLVVLACVTGCRCSPATPSAVTVRVKNGTRAPIFVDETRGLLGVAVQREVNGEWFSFDEAPCACLTCEHACESACTCPDAGVPTIRRIGPGEAFERSWSGVVQVSDVTTCGLGASCLSPENAPLNEPFHAHLCWSSSVKGFEPGDGGLGAGVIPQVGLECADATFHPQDGVVEVSPPRGADCASSADCKGQGELCLSGSCTTGCPANDAPSLGDNWSLLVASPDDRGFFTVQPRGTQTQYSGTGTLTSFVYVGTSMKLELSRTGTIGEVLTGSLSVLMPPGHGAPLTAGTKVTVLVVDGGSSKNPSNRAVTVRDATSGALLFAADMAQLGPVLSAADLAPFGVANADAPTACRLDDCGRLLLFSTTFSAPGGAQTSVDPGKETSLVTSAGTYAFLNVSNGAYTSTRCTLDDVRPWALWRAKAP